MCNQPYISLANTLSRITTLHWHFAEVGSRSTHFKRGSSTLIAIKVHFAHFPNRGTGLFFFERDGGYASKHKRFTFPLKYRVINTARGRTEPTQLCTIRQFGFKKSWHCGSMLANMVIYCHRAHH